VEMDYLIPKSQWGFRRGRSCEDCLTILNLDIYNAFIKGEMLGAIFLDIKSAYDNVSPEILFGIINSLKIPWGYKRFLRNLLGARSVEIYESGQFRGLRSIYRGLSQGSVLSPLLFNLYVKDILFKIPHNCNVIQFADDIVVYCQNRSPDEICSSLAEAFIGINTWLLSINLELSVPKTQFVIFNRSRKRALPGGLNIDGGFVKRINTAKYLGIRLDAGLRWHDHITSLKSKAAKYLNILKWLMGRRWGIDPLQAIHFINATILAQLLWGAVWYINAAKNNQNIVESILVSAYKFALGLPKNSANRVCWAYSNMPTLGGLISKISDRFICKSFQLSRKKIINKIKLIHEKFLNGKAARRNVPYLVSRWSIIEPELKSLYKFEFHFIHTYPFRREFTKLPIDFKSGWIAKNSNNPNSVFSQLLMDNRISVEELEVYTDGSKYLDEDGESRVGCAVFVPKCDSTLMFRLNGLTSSYMAEVIAIDKAVDKCISDKWPEINVCSDSLSFLQTLYYASISLFPAALGKPNKIVADLIYKINKVNFGKPTIRFT